MKKTLLFFAALAAVQLVSAQLYINEVFVSPPGTDTNNEYIEIRGAANTAIAADTYLIQIEGDGESNPGDVESNSDASNGCTVNNDGTTPCPQGGIIDLSGITLGSNGILVILSSQNTYSVDPDAVVLLDVTDAELEDQSHTFFLVNTNGNGAPSSNDDIDADDDGEIDAAYTSIWTFLDGVSFVDDDGVNNNDEFAYADVIFAEEAFDPANTPPNSINAPSTATIVYTGTQYDYAARIGNSTGSTVDNDPSNDSVDWVGGDIPSGNLPNWVLGSNSSAVRSHPESFEGSELNHIGAPNPAQNTLSVEGFTGLEKLQIFPNPAKSNISFVIPNQAEITSVEMYNILGSRVLSASTLNNNTIDVSEMTSGIYLLKINAGNNAVTKRVVIE